MYGCNILLIDTPDEYKAIISELDDNFEVNHVIAKKRNKGNKLDQDKIGPAFELNHTDLNEFMKKRRLTGEDIENT